MKASIPERQQPVSGNKTRGSQLYIRGLAFVSACATLMFADRPPRGHPRVVPKRRECCYSPLHPPVQLSKKAADGDGGRDRVQRTPPRVEGRVKSEEPECRGYPGSCEYAPT